MFRERAPVEGPTGDPVRARASGRRPGPAGGPRARLRRVAPRTVAPAAAALGGFCLTALAPDARSGIDPGLVPIVRFMAGTKLALAVAVAVAVGVRYPRGRRRVAGTLAATAMAAGAGLIWAGGAFGAAFATFLAGIAIAALLVVKELEASLRRRP